MRHLGDIGVEGKTTSNQTYVDRLVEQETLLIAVDGVDYFEGKWLPPITNF